MATTGTVANIPDAYKDERFNSDNDKATGYQTRAILCVPILSVSAETGKKAPCAVLQLINKNDGGIFSKDDEAFLVQLCELVRQTVDTSQFLRCVQGGSAGADVAEGIKASAQVAPPTTTCAARAASAAR